MRFTRTKLPSVFTLSLFSVVFVATVFASSESFAITYEITAPCSTTVARSGRYNLPSAPMTVGDATIEILSREALPYIGSDRGLNSLLQTPVGDQGLEIVSDTEMRAYGWCYEVDGRVPDELAHQLILKNSQHLRWFYAFAHYQNGDWVSFCNPATTKTHPSYCRSASK